MARSAHARSVDPRPTLVAYGAPLGHYRYSAKREMALEEAVVRSLRLVDEDPTVLLVLPVVLVKNERTLDGDALLAKARELGLEAELGMFLDLTAELAHRRRFRTLAKRLAPRHDAPRYYPEPRGGKYGRALADQRTPPVVARWGFRMDATEEDLRGFLRKHLGR